MSQNKEFTVLISVYHKDTPQFLQEALKSIWDNQSLKPSEIVLVKDGKLTPQLENVICTFDKRAPLKVVAIPKNVGLGLALAKGVIESSNEIVARMDSDDISKPNRFEQQFSIIEKGYDLVSCWSEFFEGDVNNIIAVKKRPEHHDEIVKLSKQRSPVSHAASMYRKSAVLKAGNYQHCMFNEDYYLWLRMLSSGAKFYNFQDYLYSVRTSNDQFGRRGGWKYLRLELSHLYRFYKEGYHSFSDLLINGTIRIFTRILPLRVRRFLYLKIWKYFTK